MEHTHCWDVQEGEGQSSEGRSRRSTQNRRDPGGWASLYRHPRSNRENCCQVHLSPCTIVNRSFRGHVITDRKHWSGNSITRNAFSVIFQLSYCDLSFDHILWFLGLFSNLEETHVSSPSWELELRPLGVATGNALSVTRSEDTYEKHHLLAGDSPWRHYRRTTI